MNGDFGNPVRASTAPAIKANGDFPANQPHSAKPNGSSPITQPHIYQQNNVVQHNGTYHGLNPEQAAFQPVNTGLQRYETPRTVNVPLYHNQLQDVVANQNIQQVTDTARLEHAHRGLAREFDNMREQLKTDIQVLEQRISSRPTGEVPLVQKQIEGPNFSQGASRLQNEYNYNWAGLNGTPSEETSGSLPKEQTEAVSIPVIQATASGFACCGTEFSAIGEVVEHVERMHTAPEHRRLMQQASFKTVEVHYPPEMQAVSANVHSSLPLTEKKPAAKPSVGTPKQEFSATAHTFLPLTEEKPAAKPNLEGIEPEASASAQNILPLPQEKQEAKPSFETPDQEAPAWIPVAVLHMSALPITTPEKMETFSFEFLRTTFLGEVWSPGYYFIPKKSKIPCKAYWILESEHEPFLPQQPGANGAKLTAFFNDTVCRVGYSPDPENYVNVPVFIKAAGKDEYSYFGNYSQIRFSDKIGYDTITEHIPDSVLRSHAEQLAETGRPPWVTRALKEHFWPMPKYEGPIPTDSALNSPASSDDNNGNDNSITTGLERRVTRALVEYAAELKEWEKDSKFKVNLLTAETIFESFSSADTDAEPGLRLYWEYLECVGWDDGFYKMLLRMKDLPAVKAEIGGTGKKRNPSIDVKNGSTAAKMGLAAEATFTLTGGKGKGKAKEVGEEYPGPEAKTKFVRPDFNEKPAALAGAKNGAVSNGVGKVEERKVTPKTNGSSGVKGDWRAAKESGQPAKTRDYVPPHMRGRK